MGQILALLRKDWRAFRNLRRIVREQSLFKVGFILLFAAGMIGGLWAIFAEAFGFLDKLGAKAEQKAAEVEAAAQNEPVEKAKVD